MSKALGFIPLDWQTSGRLRSTKEDQEHVEAIKSNALITNELRNLVAIQSLIFTECDPAALKLGVGGGFEKQKVNIETLVFKKDIKK